MTIEMMVRFNVDVPDSTVFDGEHPFFDLDLNSDGTNKSVSLIGLHDQQIEYKINEYETMDVDIPE